MRLDQTLYIDWVSCFILIGSFMSHYSNFTDTCLIRYVYSFWVYWYWSFWRWAGDLVLYSSSHAVLCRCVLLLGLFLDSLNYGDMDALYKCTSTCV
jgi:hypothetical protein